MRDAYDIGNMENNKGVAIGPGATAIYQQGLTVDEVTALMVALQRADQPQVWDGRIPYLGLNTFHESDAQFFFGRERLVQDLLTQIQTASFITLAGPSGSGKSSLARAGLFHALRQERLPKSQDWPLATLFPGSDPLDQLALAMERLTKVPGSGDHIRTQGRENPSALHQQIQTLLTDDPGQRFVLLVDQFEEIFTQTRDEEVRQAFIRLLTTAAQKGEGRTVIVLALRTEFVTQCARYPDLRELMSRQFLLVGVMEPEELARAITLPAMEVGSAIDPALVSRIMEDMKGEPGALPLMSFALRDLFLAEKTQKGTSMDMTLAEYLTRGGIEQALERHADRVFATFSEEEKELAQNVFSRVIAVGQDQVNTRRTAHFRELIQKGQDEDAVRRVVGVLAGPQARLLTTDQAQAEGESTDATTVTLSHERLLDAWPWLRELVDANREAIALRNQIATDARPWVETRDAGYLYRGGRLARTKADLDALGLTLNGDSADFIQASQYALRKGQVIRYGSLAAFVVLIVVALAVISFVQTRAAADIAVKATAEATALIAAKAEAINARNAETTADDEAKKAREAETEAKQQSQEARRALASQLANQAKASFSTNPTGSLLLAIEALNTTEREGDPMTSYALDAAWGILAKLGGRGIADNDGLFGSDRLWGMRAHSISKDDQWLVTINDYTNTISLWDLSVENPASRRTIIHPQGYVTIMREADPVGVEVSADGRWLMTDTQLWDLTTDPPLEVPTPNTQTYVGFSPDARWLGRINGKFLEIIDLKLEDPINQVLTLNRQDSVIKPIFLNGGWLLAPGSESKILWNLTAELPISRTVPNTIAPRMISANNRWLITHSDGEIQLWDSSGEFASASHTIETLLAPNLEDWISPDGRWMVSVDPDEGILLWDLLAPEITSSAQVLKSDTPVVAQVAFSADSLWLATLHPEPDNVGSAHLQVWDLRRADPANAPASSTLINETFSQLVSINSTGVLVKDRQRKKFRMLHFPFDGIYFLSEDQRSALIPDDIDIASWQVSPNGRWFFAVLEGADSTYVREGRIWDLSLPMASVAPTILSPPGKRVNLSPNGVWLVSTGYDGGRIWNFDSLPENVTPQPWSDRDTPIIVAAASSDRRWAVGVNDEGQLYRFDLDQDEVVGEVLMIPELFEQGGDLAISPDGRWLVMARRGQANLWDLSGSGPASSRDLGLKVDSFFRAVTFSRDGRWLVAVDADGAMQSMANNVHVWDLQTTDPIKAHWTLPGPLHEYWLEIDQPVMAISPDSKWLAIGLPEAAVALWDMQTGPGDKEAIRLEFPAGAAGGSVQALAFSENGRWLTARTRELSDRSVRLWDLHASDLSSSMRLVSGISFGADLDSAPLVKDIALSPDGRWLVTSWTGKADSVWDLVSVANGISPVTVPLDGFSSVSMVSSDGKWLFTGTAIWPFTSDGVIELACRTAGRNFDEFEWLQVFPGQSYRKICPDLPANPNMIRRETDRALTLVNSGDIAGALDVLRTGELDVVAEYEIAAYLAELGQTDEAVELFRQALDHNPSLNIDPQVEAGRIYAPVLVNEAETLARQGKIYEAIDRFTQANEYDTSLEIDAEARVGQIYATVLVEEAESLARRGEIEEAVALFTQANEYDPSQGVDARKRAVELGVPVLVAQAESLARQGKIEESVALFGQANEHDPSLEIDAVARTAELAPMPIAYGQIVTGTVASGQGQSWSFRGEAGDMVTIAQSDRDNSGLDSYLTLYGPDGEVLSKNDDFDSSDSQIDAVVLPVNGTYVILAGGYGASNGQYSLTLTLVESAP